MSKTTLFTPLICFFLSQNLAAQTTWDGGASTSNWTDALNWDTDLVPTATDAVTISGAIVDIPMGVAAEALSVAMTGSGTLQIAATASLTINTGGSFALSLNASTLLNNGDLIITNCTGGITIAAAGSTLTNNGSISVDNHSGHGLLIGTGCTGCSVDNNGDLSFDNGTNANTPAIFYQTGGMLFTNDGTIDIGLTAHAGVSIGLGAIASGSFTNNGTVNIHNTGATRAGIGTGFLGGSFINSSTGVLNAGAGIGTTWVGGFNLVLTNNGTINIDKAGTVNANTFGTGTFDGSQPFDNSNNFSPGNNGAGCLTFNDGYSNVVSSPVPVTNLQIGGTTPCTDHDKITVTGAATVDGTLTVTLINSFVPTAGQSFTLLEATSRSGTYATVNYPNVTGISWTTSYTSTAVIANAVMALPVELTHFSAKNMENQQVKLEWATASETNNAGFFIEKSTDGRAWENLGFVAGHGNSSHVLAYFFIDEKPNSSLNFYRLRQTDFDGKEELSGVVSADLTNLGDFSNLETLPNPTKGIFEIKGRFNPGTLLRITDIHGRSVKQQDLQNDATIDISHQPNGVYFMTISLSNRLMTRRIVKG